MYQSGNIRRIAARKGGGGDVSNVAKGVLRCREVAEPVRETLFIGRVSFASQIVVYQISNKHGVLEHLHPLFSVPRDRGKR